MAFEHYIQSGTKRLRLGYTTGSCAALAAKAATRMLLDQVPVTQETLMTPFGLAVTVSPAHVVVTQDHASCAVRKDAGDDIDATDGILVCATVRLYEGDDAGPRIGIRGGKGVGRVTKPGLDQPVGEAAINQVPRRMIEEAVLSVCEERGYRGCLEVEISVPAGERVAKKTFNQNLGIEGGISILGTSGIVEPRSLASLKASIELEFKQLAAMGAKRLVVVPGNYGKDYAEQLETLRGIPVVSCSNFIGEALDFSAQYGFEHVTLVGHIGKMVKLAGGIMDTHSRTADCRCELFCAHAAAAGAGQAVAQRLMEAATADACIAILEEAGLADAVMGRLAEATQAQVARRVAGAFEVSFLVFSHQYGELYRSPEGMPLRQGTASCSVQERKAGA